MPSSVTLHAVARTSPWRSCARAEGSLDSGVSAIGAEPTVFATIFTIVRGSDPQPRSTWRRTAGRRHRPPKRSRTCERDLDTIDELDAVDHHRVDLGLLDVRATLDRAAQHPRMPSASPVMPTLFATKSIVPPWSAASPAARTTADELVLLEDSMPMRSIQWSAPSRRRRPVAGALAEEVAEHRLDRRDRGRLVDLAIPPTMRWSRSPGRGGCVLAAIRVRDDADFHVPGRLQDPGETHRVVTVRNHDRRSGRTWLAA